MCAVEPDERCKRCVRCDVTKPASEFYANKQSRDGLLSYCKTCHAAYARENHERLAARRRVRDEQNREKIAAQMRAIYDTNREYLDGLKAEGCIDCKRKLPPAKLHFHHLDRTTKVRDVALLVGSRARLDAEIAKCVLVCKPCHEERHRQIGMAPTDGRTKLTEAIVREIRASSLPDAELAEWHGVTQGAIWRARHGKTWKGVSA